MVTCPNCGADIENAVDKCPYCGYINIQGAEKKYMDELDEIKEDLEQLEEESVKEFGKSYSKGLKVILWTVGILVGLALIYALLLMNTLKKMPKEFMNGDESAHASAYKAVAEDELIAAYDDRDIYKMADIYDKAQSVDRVSIWGVEHYETAYASSCYVKLKECLPNLDKEKMTRFEAEEITYYCAYFYYRAYGEDGEVIFDSIRDNEIMPILQNRLGYSIEDMERFRVDVIDGPNVSRANLYKVTKKYFKYYH